MAERINADMDWTQYTREFEMNLRASARNAATVRSA